MIFTSVDVRALRYLNARAQDEIRLIETLQTHISQGYQRQLTYQHSDGYFSAFQGSEASLWLTSYCLSIFSQAREFTTIDETVLARAAQWLVQNQNPDGSWSPIGFVIHKELQGGVSGTYGRTAFVTLALADYLGGADAILERARSYLESHQAEAETAHSLAMGAYALSLLESPFAEEALDRLQGLSLVDEEGRSYWEPVPVETTSYAVLAFYEGGRVLPASSAAAWIAARKNGRGGFGNTQDTVMALRALVRDALASSENTNVSLRIESGGEVLASPRVDADNFDVVQTFEVEPGNELTVTGTGEGVVTLQLAKVYHLPTEVLSSRGGLTLGMEYETSRIAVGGTVNALVSISYDGEKSETNMAVAEIGVPTGLRPDRGALDGLVGRDKVERIDVQGRKIIVYMDSIADGETIALPMTFQAAFQAQAAPISSKAYDYYDPAIEALDSGLTLVIGEPGQEVPFLRGDANQDSRLDVSDAIRSLGYLFQGYGPVSCPDAFDTNDDGLTDVSDPVYLLIYLFVGGSPPAPPFPDLGEDLTDDSLRCLIE